MNKKGNDEIICFTWFFCSLPSLDSEVSFLLFHPKACYTSPCIQDGKKILEVVPFLFSSFSYSLFYGYTQFFPLLPSLYVNRHFFFQGSVESYNLFRVHGTHLPLFYLCIYLDALKLKSNVLVKIGKTSVKLPFYTFSLSPLLWHHGPSWVCHKGSAI